MATLITVGAIGLFAAGAVTGIIGVLSVAIRREDKNLTLTSQATDNVTRVERWLNGVHIRASIRATAADRERTPA
jgi:hypothetical protein